MVKFIRVTQVDRNADNSTQNSRALVVNANKIISFKSQNSSEDYGPTIFTYIRSDNNVEQIYIAQTIAQLRQILDVS